MDLDDRRLAEASRALRQRQRLRQVDLTGAGRSRDFVIRLESGEAADLRLADVRAHFQRLGARVRLNVWWSGADLDRLLDERHSDLVERCVAYLGESGWEAATEVTFAEYGERGSIDVFAWHQASGSLFVGEAKSAWGSLEETFRRLDVKARLAPQIARARIGSPPQRIASVLVLPEDTSARRLVRSRAATFAATYPARNVEVRRWIRTPAGSLRGLWFLPEVGALRQRSPARRLRGSS